MFGIPFFISDFKRVILIYTAKERYCFFFNVFFLINFFPEFKIPVK